MEPQNTSAISRTKTSAKDFFINLGSIVALYTVVIALLNLLFTVIERAFPQTLDSYNYGYSASISLPVATLIIFFPIYILLMWLMEKTYTSEPEKKQLGIRRWLTYITLFVAGLVLAGDLVTVLFYFINGDEMTAAFLLKVLSVLVVIFGVFWYYLSDIREKLTPSTRMIWAGVALFVILASVIWGFVVLGSPRTQRLIKYDEQKVRDLQTLQGIVQNFYQTKGVLPTTMQDLTTNEYSYMPKDSQNGKAYEYILTDQATRKFQICAEFNKELKVEMTEERISPIKCIGTKGGCIQESDIFSMGHPAGRYCYDLTIPDYKMINGTPIL